MVTFVQGSHDRNAIVLFAIGANLQNVPYIHFDGASTLGNEEHAGVAVLIVGNFGLIFVFHDDFLRHGEFDLKVADQFVDGLILVLFPG